MNKKLSALTTALISTSLLFTATTANASQGSNTVTRTSSSALAAYNAIVNKIDATENSIYPLGGGTLLGSLYEDYIWSRAVGHGSTTKYVKAALATASSSAQRAVNTLRKQTTAYQAWVTKSTASFKSKYGAGTYKAKDETYSITTLITQEKFSTCNDLPPELVGIKLTDSLCFGITHGFGQSILPLPKATTKQYIADATNAGQAVIAEARALYSQDNAGQMSDKATPKQITAALVAAKGDAVSNGGPELYEIVGSNLVVTVGGQVAVIPW